MKKIFLSFFILCLLQVSLFAIKYEGGIGSGGAISTGTIVIDGHIEITEGEAKTFVDMPVVSISTGLKRGYTNTLDGDPIFGVEGTTDGGGGVTDKKLVVYENIEIVGDNKSMTFGSTTTVIGFRDNNGTMQIKDLGTGSWRNIIGARKVYVNSLQDILDNADFDGYNITFRSGLNYEISNTIFSPYPFWYPIGGYVAITHSCHGDTVLVNISTTTMHNSVAPGIITMFDGIHASPTADFFNINGTGAGIIVLSRFIINGATGLGNINTVSAFLDFFLAQDVGDGITFTGNTSVVYRNSGSLAWKNNSTTMITLDGVMLYAQIQQCAFGASSNEYIIDNKPTFTPLSYIYSANNHILSGAGIFAPGSQKQEQLTSKYSGNTKIADSRAYTNVYFEGNTTATPIAAINVSTAIIADVFTEINSERITISTTTGIVTYVGLEPLVLSIDGNCIMEPAIGGTQTLEVYIYKNGIEVMGSKGSTSTSPNNPRSASYFASVTMNTNDNLQVWCKNTTAGNDILIIDLHVLIKQ